MANPTSQQKNKPKMLCLRHLWLCVLWLAAAFPLATGEPRALMPVPVPHRRALILFPQSMPTPAHVAAHAAMIDRLPADGLVLRGVTFTAQTVSTTPLNASAVRAEMRLVRRGVLSNVTQVWAMVHALPAGPLAAWTSSSAVVSNFAVLAHAARDFGWAGIFFDVEDYTHHAWPPSIVCPAACPMPCLPAPPSYAGPGCNASCLGSCRKDALEAGASVMQSVLAAWPSARVLTSHGPWLSENKTAAYLRVTMPGFENGANFAKDDPVVGSFAIGLLSRLPAPGRSAGGIGSPADDGADTQPAQYHDGAEMYIQNTAADVDRMRRWLKDSMSNSSLTPAEVQPSFSRRLTFSPGVYDFPHKYHGKGPGTPAMWENDITVSMRGMDPLGITWAYSEAFDWVGLGVHSTGKPPVPQAWLEATARARAAGQRKGSPTPAGQRKGPFP